MPSEAVRWTSRPVEPVDCEAAFEAMATNNILQILVFSIFAGVALSAIGEKGAALVRGADALADEAIARKPEIDALLRQEATAAEPFDTSLMQLRGVAG